MGKRKASVVLLKLGAVVSAGVAFQATGCALDTPTLVNTFANTAASLFFNSLITSVFGLGGGFGF